MVVEALTRKTDNRASTSMIFHGPLSLKIPKNQVVSKKSKSVLQQAYFEFLFAEGGQIVTNIFCFFFSGRGRVYGFNSSHDKSVNLK